MEQQEEHLMVQVGLLMVHLQEIMLTQREVITGSLQYQVMVK